MPNLDPWVDQYNNDYEYTATKTINNFENHLLSIRAERQEMIHPKSHPTYNEGQQKIIKMIDWTLEKYKAGANSYFGRQKKGILRRTWWGIIKAESYCTNCSRVPKTRIPNCCPSIICSGIL